MCKCHISDCQNQEIEVFMRFSGSNEELKICKQHWSESYVYSGYAFENYKILERDFLNYTKHVPLSPLGETLTLATRIHSDFILRACNQLELVFRDWINSPHHRNFEDIDKLRKNNSRININKYYELLSQELILDEPEHNKVSVWPLGKSIEPFKNWGISSSPEWWTAYNKIKHNGFYFRELATLNNVILALASLFLANCRHPNARFYLEKLYLPFETERKKKNYFNNDRTIKHYITPIGKNDYLFKIIGDYFSVMKEDFELL